MDVLYVVQSGRARSKAHSMQTLDSMSCLCVHIPYSAVIQCLSSVQVHHVDVQYVVQSGRAGPKPSCM